MQACLEKDPAELAISSEVFSMLKRSNAGRFRLLTDLLCRLGLNCDKPKVPRLSPLWLLPASEVSRK